MVERRKYDSKKKEGRVTSLAWWNARSALGLLVPARASGSRVLRQPPTHSARVGWTEMGWRSFGSFFVIRCGVALAKHEDEVSARGLENETECETGNRARAERGCGQRLPSAVGSSRVR